MLDLLIRNGLVFDGLGSPPDRCDLGILRGRIAALGPGIELEARETIDASGLWVTPGFLDIHTHYDLELEIAPGLAESVRHGVTSVIIGNCSLSLAIGKPRVLADTFQRVETIPHTLIREWLMSSVDWRTPVEYLDHLRSQSCGPNVAALFGHSALRAHVMGLERSLGETATGEELAAMRRIAEEALDAGFIGISIDMLPWHMMSGELRGRTIPSQHADLREYSMLARVCRERDAVFQVTPNPHRLMSLIDIVRFSHGLMRRPLRITILSALDSVADRRLWKVFGPLLFFLNRILRCNVRFQTLTEPFTVYSDGPITPLFEEFPSGVRLNDCQTREERRILWKSPGFRDRFRSEWTRGWRKTFHRNLELMTIVRCPDDALIGKTCTAVAFEVGADPVDYFIDLLEKYDTDLRWVSTGANDRPMERMKLMNHPHILPGFTDAGAHVQNLGYYDGALSLIKQAYSSGLMPVEKAVSRVTGEPARWFRLDTGVLKIGSQADFLLIDPAHLDEPISEQIEISDPLLDGSVRMVKRGSDRIIDSVYIRGVRVIRRGEVLDALGREKTGRVLTSITGIKKIDRLRHRNRINDSIRDHPFTDYWDIFVLKHQNPWNIALHAAGVLIFYGLLLAAYATSNPLLLFLLPLSQLTGLAGHYLFERSHIDLRDAVFSIRASRCLNRMFYGLITGTYKDELIRTNRILREYLNSNHEDLISDD